jgi:hypothetical protein
MSWDVIGDWGISGQLASSTGSPGHTLKYVVALPGNQPGLKRAFVTNL